MTAQRHEILNYEGEEFSMACEPFYQYVIKNKIELWLDAPNSALWRGYLGSWEITENKLYLTKISGVGIIRNSERFRFGRLELKKKLKDGLITPQENQFLIIQLKDDCMEDIELSLKSLFNTEEKIFADWFTGIIVCHDGDILQYVHMGYESVFEYEIYFEIIDGELKNITNKSNKPKLNFFQKIINLFYSKFKINRPPAPPPKINRPPIPPK